MDKKIFRTGHSLSRISYDSTIIEIVKDKKRPAAWAFGVGCLGCLSRHCEPCPSKAKQSPKTGFNERKRSD